MNIALNILLTLALSFTLSIEPIIIKGTTLINSVNSKKAPVTILHGAHSDYVEQVCTLSQQKSIMKNAQKLKAAIIAEDPWDYSGSHKGIALHVDTMRKNKGMAWPNRFIKVTNDGPIKPMWTVDVFLGIGELCKKAGIPFFNCECRFYKDAAALGYNVTNKEVLDSNIKLVDEIFSWADDEHFLLYPAICADALHKNEIAITIFRSNISISKLLATPLATKIRSSLLYFGFEFVELRALHGIDLFKKEAHIVICAGGLHCDDIEKILKKHGYKELYSASTKYGEKDEIIEVDPLDIDHYFEQVITGLARKSDLR